MGFVSVRGDLEPASVCGVELHLFLVGVWGGVASHSRWCVG